MDPNVSDKELGETLQQRFKQLPKVVQDAITSADIEKRLRELADSHKLHIDQWQLLENEVMLTLLGFQDPEDLPTDLAKDLELGEDVARSLSADVSHIVFEPIRAQLEARLEVPGTPEGVSADDITQSRTFEQAVQQPAPVVPATPPSPPPTERAVRAPISSSYEAQQPSHERKIIEGDPYREQVL